MIEVEEIHKLFRKKDDIMSRLNDMIRKRGHLLYQRGMIKECIETPDFSHFKAAGVYTTEVDHSIVISDPSSNIHIFNF